MVMDEGKEGCRTKSAGVVTGENNRELSIKKTWHEGTLLSSGNTVEHTHMQPVNLACLRYRFTSDNLWLSFAAALYTALLKAAPSHTGYHSKRMHD